jgi:hypothetical protein
LFLSLPNARGNFDGQEKSVKKSKTPPPINFYKKAFERKNTDQKSDETLMQNMMATKNRKRMWNLSAPSVVNSPVLKLSLGDYCRFTFLTSIF